MYKTKQNYSINPLKCLLIGGMIGVATLIGCRKKPTPTPPTPQPDPTDTIVIPTKEKVFDVDWRVDGATTYYAAPPADSIKKYTSDPEYKYVIINFMNKDPNAEQEGMSCSGYPTRVFKRARDTLQTRLDINTKKVRGSGTIIVTGTLPDDAIWPLLRRLLLRTSPLSCSLLSIRVLESL